MLVALRAHHRNGYSTPRQRALTLEDLMHSPRPRASWRRPTSLAVLVLTLVAAFFVAAGPAQAASVTACGTGIYATDGSKIVHCYAPTVTTLEHNTTACPGSAEYFSRNDYNGVPIDWTYTASTHACISIDWNFSALPSDCGFMFYVPNGFATGTIWFTEDNGNGTPALANINENPVSGWQDLWMSPGTFWVSSSDYHGSVPTAELGWGTTSSYSLMAICPR
jgi:hypothetical protein